MLKFPRALSSRTLVLTLQRVNAIVFKIKVLAYESVIDCFQKHIVLILIVFYVGLFYRVADSSKIKIEKRTVAFDDIAEIQILFCLLHRFLATEFPCRGQSRSPIGEVDFRL